MKELTIDVVIPVYNGSKFILGVVQTLFEQVYPIRNWIFVNDGSTDDTLEQLLLCSSNHQRMIVIDSIHKGLPHARNVGILVSTSEVIAFLDVDDRWGSLKLKNQIHHMTNHPGCEAVFSRSIEKFEGNQKIKITSLGSADTSKYTDIILGNFIVTGSASSIIFKRNSFDKVGLFNETYSYGEDLEMWIRCSKSMEICVVNSLDVEIFRSKGSMQSTKSGKGEIFKHNNLMLRIFSENLNTLELKQFKMQLEMAFWGDLKKNLRHGLPLLRSYYSEIVSSYPELVGILFPSFRAFIHSLRNVLRLKSMKVFAKEPNV